MKYFKLLIANLFVAAILALALTGMSKADGVDDPTFYQQITPKKHRSYGQIFDWCMSSRFNNMASRCRQYDDMGPFNWPPEVVDIPSTMIHVKQQATVPEPTTIIILLWSAALAYGYKKVLK
jgi:hypothetical protein